MLNEYLLNADLSVNSVNLHSYLKCYHTLGLLYILAYRYALSTDAKLQTIVYPESCTRDLTEFLSDLNLKFELSVKIEKTSDLNTLFCLYKLQLLNVYACNTLENFKAPEQLFESFFRPVYNLNGLIKSGTRLNAANLEASIQNQTQYAAVHAESIVFSHAYLVVPFIRADHALCQQMYRNLFELASNRRQNEQKFELADVNLNALCNDSGLLKDMFVSFIQVLIDNGDEASCGKFLRKILELINSDFADEDAKKALFDAKKFAKIELNAAQVEIFKLLTELVPIEYLSAEFGLVCFFLNEKISTQKKNESVQKFYISNYIRLAEANTTMHVIPICKLETWIVGLFDSLLNKSLSDSSVIFDKVIRKSVNLMIKDTTNDYLAEFIEKVNFTLRKK